MNCNVLISSFFFFFSLVGRRTTDWGGCAQSSTHTSVPQDHRQGNCHVHSPDGEETLYWSSPASEQPGLGWARDSAASVIQLFYLYIYNFVKQFHYKQEGTYAIGTVGMVDVDCDFIDFTYVRCHSAELDRMLRKEVTTFRDSLRSSDGSLSNGQVSYLIFVCET